MKMSDLKKQGYSSVEAYNKARSRDRWLCTTYKGNIIMLKNAVMLSNGTRAFKHDPDVVMLYDGQHDLKSKSVEAGDGKWYSSEVEMLECYLSKKKYPKAHMRLVHVAKGKRAKWIYRHATTFVPIANELYLNNEVAESFGFTLCNDCSSWVNESRGNRCACYSRHIGGYHSYQRKDLSNGARYRFGMEIEKEDETVISTLFCIPMYKKTAWCIESDGSLDSYCGFEAVSPVLDLFNDKQIAQHFSFAKAILNASYSSNCGGHIHVSDTNRGSNELFDDCAGYFPLLYALYPKRKGGRYCIAGKKQNMVGHKYSAVNVTSKTVEFRIFPSPKNVATQWWRLGLLRIMLKNPRRNVREVLNDMLNVNSELFKHLSSQYPTFAKYLPKVKLVVDMAISIEGERISMSEFDEKAKALTALLGETPPTADDHSSAQRTDQSSDKGNPSAKELPAELQMLLADNQIVIGSIPVLTEVDEMD